jgi:type II secretory pathway pseudopilin PulG
VRAIKRQFNKKTAFTIVEILTVMSIIVILITLLVPSLNMAKRYAKNVRQKAQFHSIDVALDLFNADWQGYPPSDANDEADFAYCGAMKLCEALMGQDLLGFHPNSRFRCDGTMDGTIVLYPLVNPSVDNLKSRKGPYLQLENANAYKLKYIYGVGQTGVFNACGQERFVLCDIYNNVTLKPDSADAEPIRGKCGMPILYYKARTSKFGHDPNDPANSIYNYNDNAALVALNPPWDSGSAHPLTIPKFYSNTWDKRITTMVRPYRSDSYILLSAGYDGLYGTPDDIFNFGE